MITTWLEQHDGAKIRDVQNSPRKRPILTRSDARRMPVASSHPQLRRGDSRALVGSADIHGNVQPRQPAPAW